MARTSDTITRTKLKRSVIREVFQASNENSTQLLGLSREMPNFWV